MRGQQLQKIALGLPEAEERETWGEATFRVRNKIFVIAGTDGKLASVKASIEEQTALISADPEVFSVAAYVGRYGWVRVDVTQVDPGEMRELVTEAWRMTAPKRLVAAFDAEQA
jgi:hypothetical protein